MLRDRGSFNATRRRQKALEYLNLLVSAAESRELTVLSTFFGSVETENEFR